jgi:hypothetical protein
MLALFMNKFLQVHEVFVDRRLDLKNIGIAFNETDEFTRVVVR